MKKIAKFIWSLLLVSLSGTSPAFSQESIAPLLSNDTIAIVHVNLKNVDFDRLAQSNVNRIDSFFEKFNYDGASREAIAREAKSLIVGKLNLIRPLYQMFIMGARLDEICVVSYASGLKTAPAIVAVPLEGKTANQITMLESFFNNAPFKPFPFEGFLILAVPVSPDKGEEAAEWIKKHLQEDRDVARMGAFFQNMPEDTIFRAVVIKPTNVQELLDSVDLSQVPPQVFTILNVVLDKFQWIAFEYDPYACSVRVTVQTSSETDAKELHELFQAAQDAGVEAIRLGLYAGIAHYARENSAWNFGTEYVPLLTEVIRGTLRKKLPQIDGSRLVFSCP